MKEYNASDLNKLAMEIILYANDIWIVGGYMGGAWTIPKME